VPIVLKCESLSLLKTSGSAQVYNRISLLLPSYLRLSKNVNIEAYTNVYNFSHCMKLSLTLREERRLRVFENRVFRGIFWPTRDKVTR